MDFSTLELAKYLRNIRESLGYSIYDVNKLCDISPSYLSLMENGKRRPSPSVLKKLSSIYHINYNDLLIKAGFSELVENEDVGNKFSNRLKMAMQIRNMKAIELSEKANIPKSAISQYLSGVYEAKQKSIFKIANVLNVSEGWLMGLDVPMERQKSNNINIEKTDTLGNPVTPIPILGTIKAGYDYIAQENWIGTVDVETSLIKDGEEYFALKVKGDSMAPVFVEDDIVIIKKQKDCENIEFAVFSIDGDEGTLKKIKKTNDGIILQPLNPAYGPVMYTYDEVQAVPVIIVGVVKQLKREF